MRKWDLKLDFEFHESRELHVLDDDRDTLADDTFSNTNLQHDFPVQMSVCKYINDFSVGRDLRVHFIFDLLIRHVGGIFRSKAKFPVHLHNIVFCLWVCLDMIKSEWLGT